MRKTLQDVGLALTFLGGAALVGAGVAGMTIYIARAIWEGK